MSHREPHRVNPHRPDLRHDRPVIYECVAEEKSVHPLQQGSRDAASAAEEAKATAKDARAIIGKLSGPTADFASNGLPQVTAAVIQLQSAAESLERLVNEIQSSPTGALGKPAAEELKVKP